MLIGKPVRVPDEDEPEGLIGGEAIHHSLGYDFET